VLPPETDLHPLRFLSAAIALALASTAAPSPDPELPLSCPPPAPLRLPERPAEHRPEAAEIRAEHFSARPGSTVIFRDSVRLSQYQQRLETDELIYHPDSGRVDIPGWLRYSDPQFNVDAGSAWYETRERRGRFDRLSYAIPGTAARGSAQSAELLDPDHARLEVFDFTTCPPDQLDWQISMPVWAQLAMHGSVSKACPCSIHPG